MDALPHLPRGHRAAALLPAVTPRPHPVLRPPRVDVGRGLGADVRVRLHRRLRIRGLLDHDVLRPRKQVGRSAVYVGAHVPPMPVLLGRRSGHHGEMIWERRLTFIASSFVRFADAPLESESQSATGITVVPCDLESMILYVAFDRPVELLLLDDLTAKTASPTSGGRALTCARALAPARSVASARTSTYQPARVTAVLTSEQKRVCHERERVKLPLRLHKPVVIDDEYWL